MPGPKFLEIACFNLSSALIAQQAGASRIELCENYAEGGLTPSAGLVAEATEKISIPLHVIVRPHSNGFVYSGQDLQAMEAFILFCRSKQVNGIVFGALTPGNTIDVAACKKLIATARPMSVTFHRAVDQCADIHIAMQDLIGLGINRVLTSGGIGNAANNVSALAALNKKFGKHITVMPGGGIRAGNLAQLFITGCTEYHSAALATQSDSADASEVKALRQMLDL